MTALCGGGPSGPLPLVDPVIQLTAAVAEAIAAVFGVAELGIPLSLAVAGLSLVAADTCSHDPPADPGLVQQDVIDAMNVLEPFVAIPAQARLRDWFLHRYWWQICQCTGSVTPPPPVPSNPNTPVGIGTGAPSGLNAPPCWTGSGPHVVTSSVFLAAETVSPWLPAGPGSQFAVSSGPLPFASVPPPGTTGYSWSLSPTPGAQRSAILLQAKTATNTEVPVGQLADSADSSSWSGTATGFTPSATHGYYITIQPVPIGGTGWSAGWTGEFSWICSSGPPNSIVQPCCPPDPLIDIKLDKLLGLVLDLYGRPGAAGIGNYTKGTVHAGLSGSGSIPVSGRVGVLVDITAQATAPVLPGNPPYLFDQGWLSVLTADGFIDEKRLTRTTQIWLPALFPISTQFGYFFNPGVTATVTELLPA